ncbi:MAG: D-TA family PLP-dependent enzyme [Bacteroidota bacterium]
MQENWYQIKNIESVDSPSVVLYQEHLQSNIQEMVKKVDGDLQRLMPHVKTNKMPRVMEQLLHAGITKFKASTIAETEIAAEAGAESVLIAHQLVGPKVQRFLKLPSEFPNTRFSTLVDTENTSRLLNQLAQDQDLTIGVYIDINNGMNRSGIQVGESLEKLVQFILSLLNLEFLGFHVYDGHLRDTNFELRRQKIEDGFIKITQFFNHLKTQHPTLEMICGGTPSFTSHLLNQDRITSPGTCVLWDWGYGEKLTEQSFSYAALLVTRVISKPAEGIITLDLGHKSVAAENPIYKRVKFLNLDNYELLSQSEEHGVVKVSNWDKLQVGDVLYGVPYHICPTINLHDEVSVISDGKKVDSWEISARKRKLRF